MEKKKKFTGGALRDVGIYTLSMADMVFEEEPSIYILISEQMGKRMKAFICCWTMEREGQPYCQGLLIGWGLMKQRLSEKKDGW